MKGELQDYVENGWTLRCGMCPLADDELPGYLRLMAENVDGLIYRAALEWAARRIEELEKSNVQG